MINLAFYDDGNIYHTPNLNDLYKHRNYFRPVYSEWKNWYAWYPVIAVTWVWVPELDSFLKNIKLEWLTTVVRRKVVVDYKIFKKIYHEHTTLYNVLKFC